MSPARLFAVLLAALAQAGVIAWYADFVYESHSQAAAMLAVPAVVTWLLGSMVLAMGWMPLIGAGVLAALVAFFAGWTRGRETAATGYLFCAVAIGLLAFAGWQWGLTHWPPPAPGVNDSRGTLFHVLLGITALVYVPFTAFAVWVALGPRRGFRADFIGPPPPP